jgi:hypothetical protein
MENERSVVRSLSTWEASLVWDSSRAIEGKGRTVETAAKSRESFILFV